MVNEPEQKKNSSSPDTGPEENIKSGNNSSLQKEDKHADKTENSDLQEQKTSPRGSVRQWALIPEDIDVKEKKSSQADDTDKILNKPTVISPEDIYADNGEPGEKTGKVHESAEEGKPAPTQPGEEVEQKHDGEKPKSPVTRMMLSPDDAVKALEEKRKSLDQKKKDAQSEEREDDFVPKKIQPMKTKLMLSMDDEEKEKIKPRKRKSRRRSDPMKTRLDLSIDDKKPSSMDSPKTQIMESGGESKKAEKTRIFSESDEQEAESSGYTPKKIVPMKTRLMLSMDDEKEKIKPGKKAKRKKAEPMKTRLMLSMDDQKKQEKEPKEKPEKDSFKTQVMLSMDEVKKAWNSFRTKLFTPEEKEEKVKPEPGPEDKTDEEDEMEFLSPEEMIDRTFGVKVEETAKISLAEKEEPEDEDEIEFLTPEEMAKRQARFTGDVSELTVERGVEEERKISEEDKYLSPEEMAKRQARFTGDASELEVERLPVEAVEDEDEEDKFLTPDEMIEKKLRRAPKRIAPVRIDLDSIDTFISAPLQEAEAERAGFYTPEEEIGKKVKAYKKTTQEKYSLTSADDFLSLPLTEEEEKQKQEQVLDKIKQLTLYELEESETVKEKRHPKQLNLGPILKKKDIESPVDLFSPDEIEEEEEFVSLALEKGTVIKERFKIVSILKEKRNSNTYVVKDLQESGRKLILKEIIMPEMEKEEYWKRRDAYRDAIRIISTFQHPNLSVVYEGFPENYRIYSYMEKIEGLNLEQLAKMNIKGFREDEVVKWGVQLCEAVEFMHFRPKPFTLGALHPHHIMFDDSGRPRITGYNLKRFFDPDRTIEFMHDDSTKLYEDVTKVARILYFLLTKRHYNPNDAEVQWPYPVGPKMQKLIETAAAEGQKTYGDIREFTRKLKGTQIEDKPEAKRKSLFGFPLHKLDFRWVKSGVKAVLNQHPLILASELLIIVFLIFLAIGQHVKSIYARPGAPLAYVFAGDGLLVYNAADMELIHKLPMEITASAISPEKVTIKPKGEKKPRKINTVIVGFKNADYLQFLDSSNLNTVLKIKSLKYPAKIISGLGNDEIYTLHTHSQGGDSGVATRINLKEAKTVRMYPAGQKPVDFILLKPDDAVKHFKEKSKPANDRTNEVKETDNVVEKENKKGFPVLIISNSESGDILFINADTGMVLRKLYIQGSPGALVFIRRKKAVYIADVKNNDIKIIDLETKTIIKKIDLPGQAPSAMAYDNVKKQIWISLKKSDAICVLDVDSDSLVDISETNKDIKDGADEKKLLRGVGSGPYKLLLDGKRKRLWTLCEKSKKITVVDVENNKVIKRFDIGSVPTAVSLEADIE